MDTSFTSHTLPAHYRKNIVQMKRALKAHIGDVSVLFQEICDKLDNELKEARRDERILGSAWPEIDWSDLAEGRASTALIEQVKRRGCLIVRQTFERAEAIALDKSILEYLDENNFHEKYKGPGDNFFGSLGASKPEIYPIYWSKSQMQARQSANISSVQSFLNHLWAFEKDGITWFDPDVNIIYPDRIRRRSPGITSNGLGAHTDSGALERWLLPAYQKIFEKIFSNNFSRYDPWDASHRPEVEEYTVDNTTKCSIFRTFQGWTALSDMLTGQGLLHVVPVPEAMAYILLRPLLEDVPEDELCGVEPGRVLPISKQWHPHLIKGLCSIPSLNAGDSVWWHCDMIHSVAPVTDQKGWGNVMYIPTAPMCEKNRAYAISIQEALKQGMSPPDFPREHYEQYWKNRFEFDMLNDIGRKALAL